MLLALLLTTTATLSGAPAPIYGHIEPPPKRWHSPCASAPPACQAAAREAILAWRADAEECGFARRECVIDLRAAESTLDWLTASSSTTPGQLVRAQDVAEEGEGWGFWEGAGLGAGAATIVAVLVAVLVATR